MSTPRISPIPPLSAKAANEDRSFIPINNQPASKIPGQTTNIKTLTTKCSLRDIELAAVPEEAPTHPKADRFNLEAFNALHAQLSSAHIAPSHAVAALLPAEQKLLRKEIKNALSSLPKDISFIADNAWITKNLPLCLQSGLSKKDLLFLHGQSSLRRGFGHRNLTENDRVILQNILDNRLFPLASKTRQRAEIMYASV